MDDTIRYCMAYRYAKKNWRIANLVWRTWPKTTRQHSYRKEDRAMRPIYGCT